MHQIYNTVEKRNKLIAISMVEMLGQDPVTVARDFKIPESTLRGWLEAKDNIISRCKLERELYPKTEKVKVIKESEISEPAVNKTMPHKQPVVKDVKVNEYEINTHEYTEFMLTSFTKKCEETFNSESYQRILYEYKHLNPYTNIIHYLISNSDKLCMCPKCSESYQKYLLYESIC